VLALLHAGSISGEDVVGALIAVSEVAAEKMGGTSGALYSCVPPVFLDDVAFIGCYYVASSFPLWRKHYPLQALA
jgi:hypothetical protein